MAKTWKQYNNNTSAVFTIRSKLANFDISK
jgi:hypothetical protein